jgi:hypothetical protein
LAVDGNRPGRNCRFLLGSLIALLVAFPFLEDVAQPLILVMPLAGVFVAGVVVVDPGRWNVRRAVVLAALQIGLTMASLFLHETHLLYLVTVSLAMAVTAALILFATYCVMGYVMRARTITRDQIYAGICMYIMLGFAFGAVFYLVNVLNPGSFSASTAERPDLVYFSFVTLATLGYGDITPRSNIARSLTVVEALVGMLYIAIFMARLVSLRVTDETG